MLQMAWVRCEPICGIWRYMLQASHNKLWACCALMGKVAGCQLGCVVLEAARISFLPSFLPIYTHMYLSTCLPLPSLFWRVYRLYNALAAYPATRMKRIVLSYARWLYLEARLLRSSFTANVAFILYIVLV